MMSGDYDKQRVIVAGGGIAGIACALRLSERGVPVTLIETRKKLGGRATSFVDVRTGETLDNCQHVAMGCCTSYLDFLARMGALDKLEWTREQYWIEPGGRTSIIQPSFWPAPGHFGPSVLNAKFLTLGEKLTLARGMTQVLAVKRDDWRTRTFADFLASAGQTSDLIAKFWEPVVVSACNLPSSRVCATSALHVFQDGFCAHRDAAKIGVSRVPLLELYDRAQSAIESAGGTVMLGSGIERLDRTSVTLTSGQQLLGTTVVCALPCERAMDVIDESIAAIDPRVSAMRAIEHSPILGVHLRFDRPVLTTPHAVLVRAGVQWLFRKDASGASIHAVISGADDWMPLTEQEIAQRVLSDIESHIPAARGARALSVRPVKEKRATFAATPQFEASRPTTLGPSGLILAGDYTRTGWPATMEGAARSGYAAAAAVMGLPASELIPQDLAPARLVKWIRSGVE